VVLALTGVWHGLAAWHFGLYPERTLARSTDERPPHKLAAEVFRFLAGMNLAAAALAFGACFVPAAVPLAAASLSLANLTQYLGDRRVHRLGLARGPFFLQIYVGDAVFFVLNALVVAVALGR